MPNDFKTVKNYADFLMSLSSNELTLLGAGIGFLLSQNLNGLQATSLGGFFELIGQTLLTYGAQQQLLENRDKE